MDADPTALEITSVTPSVILEGQGTGGSRPAVVVVRGKQITPEATVAIAAHAGSSNTPLITVDNAKREVSADGTMIAVPVTLAVDANLGPAMPPATASTIRLDVTVSQPSPAGVVTKTLAATNIPVPDSPVLTLQGLDELTSSAPLPTATPHVYSRVTVTSLAAADATAPLIIRCTSSVTITGTSRFNASGQTAANSGGTGGNGGVGVVGSPGSSGGGSGGGVTAGGGGGFAAKGQDGATVNTGGVITGEPALTSWTTNRAGGGAGGNGGIANIEGGRGGGGGGAIEISADGDLTIGTIELKGGNATTSSNTTGGGGAGGAALLRAGGTINIAGVTATGGTGAGAGSVGRVRFDAGAPGASVPASPTVAYRGPMLDATTPMIVRTATPTITVVGQASTLFKYFIEDDLGNIAGPVEATIPATGSGAFTPSLPLISGFDRLCLLVAGAQDTTASEAKNCITLAYVP